MWQSLRTRLTLDVFNEVRQVPGAILCAPSTGNVQCTDEVLVAVSGVQLQTVNVFVYCRSDYFLRLEVLGGPHLTQGSRSNYTLG